METQKLLAQAIEQLADAHANRPPEAPASISFKVESPAGFELLLTVRNGSMSGMLKDWHKMEAFLLDHGFTPAGNRRPAAPQPAAAPNADAADTRTAGAFPVEAIEYGGKSSNGGDVWKVKGGNFAKWGLPLYPEIAQLSGLHLDPANPPQVGNWTAHYFETPDGKKKITRIEIN